MKRELSRVCGVDCHKGEPTCNGYCDGLTDRPQTYEVNEPEFKRFSHDQMRELLLAIFMEVRPATIDTPILEAVQNAVAGTKHYAIMEGARRLVMDLGFEALKKGLPASPDIGLVPGIELLIKQRDELKIELDSLLLQVKECLPHEDISSVRQGIEHLFQDAKNYSADADDLAIKVSKLNLQVEALRDEVNSLRNRNPQ